MSKTTMHKVRPAHISEESFNKVFELVDLPKKVGFPFALEKLFKKLQQDGNNVNKNHRNVGLRNEK
jgi:hypothetical protein